MTEVKEQLSFRQFCHSAHHGQINLSLVAYDGETPASRVEYSVINHGSPAISMITTADAYKRRGYASSVMQKLQDLFPGVEIKWGGTTNEGSRLYAMLPKHEVGVHDYKENEKRLDYVKARLGRYERLEEAFRRHPSPTDDQRTRFLDRIDDWNDLSDEAEDIERWLQRHSAKQVLLVVPGWIHRLPVG